ncbi:MAG: hypothetical protein AAF378_02870 [Cyanobacteria bacterium P01_A01_bin.84]
MTTQDKARALMQQHYCLVKRRQQSVLERTAQELGLRHEVGKYWNPVQGKLNPLARESYDASVVGAF